MRIRDLFYETFSAIQANRGRSLLTILGIVIGIAAGMVLTAAMPMSMPRVVRWRRPRFAWMGG